MISTIRFRESVPILPVPTIGKDFHIGLQNLIPEDGVKKFRTDFQLFEFDQIRLYIRGTNTVLFRGKYKEEEVVIKMLRPQEAHYETACKELEMERCILSLADHPNIVRYFGSGTHPHPFIVMEYLEDGTLGEILRAGPTQTNSSTAHDKGMRDFHPSSSSPQFVDVLNISRDLASALSYLHFACIPGASIIHRDLKPDNIGFSHGKVKLFDFGLSICVRQRVSSEEAYEMSGATGSLRYMAPEVALSLAYSEKADVYSFSIILWQVASGCVPFDSISRATFMERVVCGGLRPTLLAHWPTYFSDLLQSCWHPVPEARPSFESILCMLGNATKYASSSF